MRHLLKIKFVDSRVNTHILASTSVPIYTHDSASAKFSTNSHETDNVQGARRKGEIKRRAPKNLKRERMPGGKEGE
jgi:hypothetical protein